MQNASIPVGTVTLLFTDIEGSTKLWERHPHAMRTSLARHDHLLRHAIRHAHGHVFKTIGDAFCASFATASDALESAVAAQLALAGEHWPEGVSIRVRMALHTGAVESRDDDYFGQPLNRVARLLGAAHGGQILLSAVTQELVQDELPIQVSLRNLGEHRLKDLGRPETVFQALHPGLESDFPPLRSLDSLELRHNLPQQVTTFIGRDSELAQIRLLLGRTKLLTLTGSGGTGKTRLALQAAANMLDGHGDGVWLVELAPLTDPALVYQAVAQVLGLKEEIGKPILQTLVDHLKPRSLALVLDNCEHLLSECASLADALIRQCPDIAILATSREALNIAGESTYRVPSLSLPDSLEHLTAESIAPYEAVRLFVERAQSHHPQFVVTDHNAVTLASVCRRLDGIPLAIELAAARIRSLTVEEINQKLEQRFRLLTGGSRTALPRQRTLRSLIDWSYDLLAAEEKAMLCRLSVFSGGWTLEAAEQVCAGDVIAEWAVFDLLTSLADKSLVQAEERDGTTRHRLLETVRQYALDKLLEESEAERWRWKHLDWCLALAESAMANLQGPDQALWLGRLETEYDNLREGLAWCAEEPEGAEAGLRLCYALSRFWEWRGYFREGRERCAIALAHPGVKGVTEARARTLNGVGILAFRAGDLDAGRAFLEEALTMNRNLGDRIGEARNLGNLGNVARFSGDPTGAQRLFTQVLELSRELGNRGIESVALDNLALIALDQDDYAVARSLSEQSLAIDRELGNKSGEAISLGNLGSLAKQSGDDAAARAYVREALTINRELKRRLATASCLEVLADVEAGSKPKLAATLAGAAWAVREALGVKPTEIERRWYDPMIASLRKSLEDGAFDEAWKQGFEMNLEAAVDLASSD